MKKRTIFENFYAKILSLVAICTVILTAAFVGIIAFISGDINEFNSRLPYYTVLLGAAFVLTIILLESQHTKGQDILITSVTVSIITTVVSLLAVEGTLFAYRFPERVFVSQLVVYFTGASLIAIGFGFWGIRHWREFIGNDGI